MTFMPAFQETYSVSMTGYNAVPEQTDGNPLITASGVFSDPDVVAARSRDLADELPFGTVIEIVSGQDELGSSCGLSVIEPMVGLRVIADSMHSRKHQQIDILFHADTAGSKDNKRINPARTLGVCKDVKIRVVGMIDIAHMPKTQAELAAAVGHSSLAVRN